MKFTRLHLAALSVGLAFVGTMALPNSADAQRGQAGGEQPQGGGGRGQGRGQGGGGFGRGGMMGGMFSNTDPIQNSASQLLRREDVQNELALNGTQKEKMQANRQQGGQNIRQKMQESGIDFRGMGDMTPEQRQEMMQKIQTMRQGIEKTMASDQQKQIDEILTAPQRKRLAELDLQYRGPLALGEEAVAKRFNLTPDQQREVGNVVTEYRTGREEAMRAVFPNRRGGGGNNAGGGQPGQPGQFEQLDPVAAQARLEESRKSIDRIKKGSSDKIVALLSDSQKAAWKAVQGKPFVFKQIASQFGGRGGGGNLL